MSISDSRKDLESMLSKLERLLHENETGYVNSKLYLKEAYSCILDSISAIREESEINDKNIANIRDAVSSSNYDDLSEAIFKLGVDPKDLSSEIKKITSRHSVVVD